MLRHARIGLNVVLNLTVPLAAGLILVGWLSHAPGALHAGLLVCKFVVLPVLLGSLAVAYLQRRNGLHR